ncbi:hypothetical protein FOA43_003403 [Brettanomyces nanus]|uniref:Peroxidase n=1 Tax=Eeniella nana TaxID=13502 RepID=A0A875RW34_EENNA|nr:uncharacterized protein FOA43_003403 [Brettanomyces nanus]QPG76017.1 hypothetical protein FOA43_003403 [Brettanomyces nanus]
MAAYRVYQQSLSYSVYSLLAYIYTAISQSYQQVFLVHNEVQNKDANSHFRDAQFKRREALLNRRSRSVSNDIKDFFDIPSSFTDSFAKIWFRSAYYYDKYVVHFLDIITSSPYIYTPNGYIAEDMESHIQEQRGMQATLTPILGVDPTYEDPQELPTTKEFYPKPYILSQRSAGKIHPTDHLVSQNVFGELSKPSSPIKPALTELFDIPDKSVVVSAIPIKAPEVISDSSKPVVKHSASAEHSASAKHSASASTSVSRAVTQHKSATPSQEEPPVSKSIFYKIKIRRKNKQTSHPTYGNYDLVRRRIKDCLIQPSYQPDGNIGPNMVRFTWHCCAHYDQQSGTGGCSGGTLRFAQEFNDIGNTGLNTAKSYLDQIHEEFPWMSFADLYTLGGVVAIEGLAGPKIEWKPGRTDCPDSKKVPPMGRLPFATLGSDHVREVFTNRLGFTDKETVALIGGGHTLGGCHARFSGFHGIWTKNPFKFDNEFFKVLLEDKWSIGTVPQSGVDQYYNEDKSLMMLNTDMEMMRDPEFKKWTLIFAEDEQFFFAQFAIAYAKLIELGVIRDEDGIQRVKL